MGKKINLTFNNDGSYENGKLTWKKSGENSLRFAKTSGSYFYGRIIQNVLETWKLGSFNNPVEYKQGDRIIHKGKKYVVNITHKNYGDMNWAPGTALNLFTEI